MFRKPKIKTITSCATGDFLFVFGKARNGDVYIWRSDIGEWRLHVNQPTNVAVKNGPAAE